MKRNPKGMKTKTLKIRAYIYLPDNNTRSARWHAAKGLCGWLEIYNETDADVLEKRVAFNGSGDMLKKVETIYRKRAYKRMSWVYKKGGYHA
jgi:hypothetical protein